MLARLLLVHSPLVGPGTWDLVAAELAGRGWEVGVPDLTGTVSAGPPYRVRQAEVIARAAAGQPVILIGHSGRGRCWPRRVPSAARSRGTSSSTLACRSWADLDGNRAARAGRPGPGDG